MKDFGTMADFEGTPQRHAYPGAESGTGSRSQPLQRPASPGSWKAVRAVTTLPCTTIISTGGRLKRKTGPALQLFRRQQRCLEIRYGYQRLTTFTISPSNSRISTGKTQRSPWIYDMMNFWFTKGVDGFPHGCDTLYFQRIPPPAPRFLPGRYVAYYANGPHLRLTCRK